MHFIDREKKSFSLQQSSKSAERKILMTSQDLKEGHSNDDGRLTIIAQYTPVLHGPPHCDIIMLASVCFVGFSTTNCILLVSDVMKDPNF